MPRFSIVVPAFNAEKTLPETLDAVAEQTLGDWECIVVDDGSTDATAALAASFVERDPRFALISQENRGTGGAYNSGVRAAIGRWVTICSADDVLLGSHLETMSAAIDAHPGHDIYSCNGYYLYADGSQELVYPPDASTERSWPLEEVLAACFFSVGTCYRRRLFDEIGGYAENVFGEDYDFWLRAMARGATHYFVAEPLALHRISAMQKSANLRRAYESDIRSIGSVAESGLLDANQVRAAADAIRHRKRLIFELGPVGGPVIRALRQARSILPGTKS